MVGIWFGLNTRMSHRAKEKRLNPMKKSSCKPTDPIWSADDLVDPHAAEDKADRVRRMFDAIAKRYDLANAVISFGQAGRWRRMLATLLHRACPSPARIMDLACGTGDMMRELGRRFPQACLIGLDFSQSMLRLARKKISGSLVSYCCGDAMRLPIVPECFDAISCVFGLRNFQSLEIGIEEMLRTLKPGGHLAILEFQPPKNSFFAVCFNVYFERILPFLGKVVADSTSSGAYEYLPRSVKGWHDENFVLKLLQEHGLRIVERRRMCLGSVWAVVAKK